MITNGWPNVALPIRTIAVGANIIQDKQLRKGKRKGKLQGIEPVPYNGQWDMQ